MHYKEPLPHPHFQFLIKGYFIRKLLIIRTFSFFQFLIKGYISFFDIVELPNGPFNSSLKDTLS